MAIRADQRKFHYIYKITRTDGSDKYYIGMHSTDDLEDGYFGSGQLLWKSIKKYGKEAHTKEILEFLPDRKTLKFREKEIVNRELLKDPLCMNLCEGGEGGFNPSATTKSAREKAVLTTRDRGNIPGWAPVITKLQKEGRFFTKGMLNKKHSEITKKKMAVLKCGENNNQYGKRAFVNPETGERRILSYRPEGWKTPSEIKNETKNKNNGAYGKRWYNDGQRSYLLNLEEATGLKLGRLNPGFKNSVN